MPPLLADFSHARACKPFCEKYLTLPELGVKKLPTVKSLQVEFAELLTVKKEAYAELKR